VKSVEVEGEPAGSLHAAGRAAVIGAGAMGSGIAQVFAAAGFEVILVDPAPGATARALSAIEKGFARRVARGEMAAEEAERARARLKPASARPDLEGVEVAVEAVVEEPALKEKVLRDLDSSLPPESIIGSNTSSISITRLAAATAHPERVIGLHFFNPVPVMSLVEVVRGRRTSDRVHRRALELVEKLGKTAVTVEDFPGFVANRVLMPMINEAVFCLMEGVAGRDEIDRVMELGMRHPMGPLKLADFIGLDVCLSILEVLHRDLGDPKYRPCPLLRTLVAAGQLGKKSGQGFYPYGEKEGR
jgi:3-hydroxybutyryl-CoA dehydrogenase